MDSFSLSILIVQMSSLEPRSPYIQLNKSAIWMTTKVNVYILIYKLSHHKLTRLQRKRNTIQICFMTLGHSSVVGKESLKFWKVEAIIVSNDLMWAWHLVLKSFVQPVYVSVLPSGVETWHLYTTLETLHWPGNGQSGLLDTWQLQFETSLDWGLFSCNLCWKIWLLCFEMFLLMFGMVL